MAALGPATARLFPYKGIRSQLGEHHMLDQACRQDLEQPSTGHLAHRLNKLVTSILDGCFPKIWSSRVRPQV